MLLRALTGAMWSSLTTRIVWTCWRGPLSTPTWQCSPSLMKPAACPGLPTRYGSASDAFLPVLTVHENTLSTAYSLSAFVALSPASYACCSSTDSWFQDQRRLCWQLMFGRCLADVWQITVVMGHVCYDDWVRADKITPVSSFTLMLRSYQ